MLPVVLASTLCARRETFIALGDCRERSVSSKVEQLRAQLNERILVLDGGMRHHDPEPYRLHEEDFARERFADWPCDLKATMTALVLSKPEVIAAIPVTPL